MEQEPMLEYLGRIGENLEFQVDCYVEKPEIWAKFHSGISDYYSDLSLGLEITHADL